MTETVDYHIDPTMASRPTLVCHRCGAMVGDRDAHTESHLTTDLQLVRVQEGDVVVAKIPEHTPRVVAEDYADRLRAKFPGHQVVVSGLDLEVVRSTMGSVG